MYKGASYYYLLQEGECNAGNVYLDEMLNVERDDY